MIFLLLLLFIPPGRPIEEPPVRVQTEFIEELEDEPEEPIEPPEITEEIITEVDIVLDPKVVAEVDIEIDVVTEVTEEPVQGDPSEFDALNDDIHSPALMGIGNAGGAGGSGGAFGSRTGRGRERSLRTGGGEGTQDALDLALQWLAHHQEENGMWDCAKYEGGSHNYAVTGLATLAFLANGNTPEMGRYRDTVSKAVNWIDSIQRPDGHYGTFRYEAAFTLMAMAEAYGMTSGGADDAWRRNVQRAVDAAVAAQGPDGGWRYSPGSAGDMSVAGWWMMALKSAKESGLNVPDTMFERAKQYWTNSAVRLSGDSSYERYTGRYMLSGDRVSAVGTAALMCGRQFLGFPRHDPIIVGAAQVLLNEEQGIANWRGGNNLLPGRRTGQGQGSQDFYTWYYMALGFYQLGPQSEYWQTFNPLMKEELLTTQRKDGTIAQFRGSWCPNDGGYYGSGRWGRVGQSAVGALMFSVYYRYELIQRNR